MNYDKFIKFLKDNDISYFVINQDNDAFHYKYLDVYVKTDCDFLNKTFNISFRKDNKKYAWSQYKQSKHYNFEGLYDNFINVFTFDKIYDKYDGSNIFYTCYNTFNKRMFNKIIRRQKWYK